MISFHRTWHALYCCIGFLSLSLSGCSAIKETCLFGGCYGPFNVVLQTEDGKVAEDVIVTVAHIYGSGHGWDHTYKQVKVANSGEMLTFPRGYVWESGQGRVPLEVYASHPSYFLAFEEQQAVFEDRPNGVVDLGVKRMLTHETINKQDYENGVPALRASGMSENEIQNKRKEGEVTPQKRLFFAYHYFIEATRIGRPDLVDKYLPQLVRNYVDSNPKETKSATQVEQEYRKMFKDESGVR